MRVCLYTLGCKVNQYETEAMREDFLRRGFTVVPFGEPCDVFVINTCTVTAESDAKSRRMARRAKRENPDALVVMVGCFVDASPGAADIGDADLLFGNADKQRLAQLVEERLKSRGEGASGAQGDDGAKRGAISLQGGEGCDSPRITRFEGHTRAVIKIEDGCESFCSYCVIPYARGPVRSRPIPDILSEVRGLAQNGYREIVLTGIHLASYGKDKGFAFNLCDAIEACADVPGLSRLRLGSLEPAFITPENVARMAAVPILCPHFHLSLQSGCDETLRRMNRRYTTQDFARGVELLRTAFADCAITVDIIAGFPGETQQEFGATCDFVRRMRFSGAHIFVYSRRQGTRAADMPGQVPEPEKKRRARILADAERISRFSYRRAFEGRVLPVLFESAVCEGVYEGLTVHHIPVRVRSDEPLTNTERMVRMGTCGDKACEGELV